MVTLDGETSSGNAIQIWFLSPVVPLGRSRAIVLDQLVTILEVAITGDISHNPVHPAMVIKQPIASLCIRE